MNWNKCVRQVRWLSIAFTLTIGLGSPLCWVVYSPLLPLFLFLLTGLYMFVLPYAARWSGERRAGA